MRTLPVSFLLLLFAWTMHTWAETGRMRQKRAWIVDSFSIEEENPGPFPYKLGKIVLDRKYLVNFALYGEGVDKEPKNILTINKQTGEISVHGKVDYESITDKNKALNLYFEAINRSNSAVDTRLGVEINVLDINDNPPIFQQSNYEVTVEESHAQGENVFTLLATDKDDAQTLNGTFSFTIKSVTPKTDNVEFYIQQSEGSGTIYFKGCLDYEKAQKYKILVEAKDHGEKKQLSSTSTVTVTISDKNNHLPEFSGQTGTGKVKERDIGTEVLRLQVTDKDSHGTKAWKAKYTIQGDTKNMFQIETDPTTNEGILTVVKPMDYEEQTYQSLSISVQNEAPYFSCKIKKRPQDAMWELDRFFESPATSDPKLYKSIPVTINVEDVNDPPLFIPPVTDVNVMENTNAGAYLTTVTAIDSDGAHANTFRYIKGEDVAGWITVDEKTGNVSTAKILDRESLLVKNSIYEAIVYAVDDGTPPLTGTGTLLIHLHDQNDNAPVLTVNHVKMCLDMEPTTANITAVDLDLPPYSSPFYYELLGDVEGKWRIDPAHGTTVDLVKESNVYSGHHFLQIKISDQQGFSAIQNLSVTVCNCASDSSCHERMVSKARMGGGGVFIIMLAVLLLTAMLLMVFMMTCKTEAKDFPLDGCSGHLIKTNTEKQGTDCTKTNHGQQDVGQIQKSDYSKQGFQRSRYRFMQVPFIVSNKKAHSSSVISYQHQHITSHNIGGNEFTYSYHSAQSDRNRHLYVNRKLGVLPESPKYLPYQYEYEGKGSDCESLDQLTVSNLGDNLDFLQNLGPKFSTLGGICQQSMTSKNVRL